MGGPYCTRPGHPAAVPAFPGTAVYHVCADGRTVQVGEYDLEGPLRDLVTVVLAMGPELGVAITNLAFPGWAAVWSAWLHDRGLVDLFQGVSDRMP
jgi:hypothetical protein